ncbi:hypothetical protein IW140_003263 [Coemansia sp. RSA 1813]|nr:hypothetical protein EV178_002881 [Coemansia sp. RSA 1646]KAJ1771671.1 hypothetical protein LPJ74_002098 [Coemansia sp. RSA 1843]KAJ2089691.1 hypothetical protein IW138_003289 [Coemansia sp. RSA 986]KAJ2214112.1 hypothetical protein EV179_003251 [Coemansia sp. RSA 487]KAJ2569171.1 hypothetical protein IW140_003263 [Coemansia sp. RSA 1813]
MGKTKDKKGTRSRREEKLLKKLSKVKKDKKGVSSGREEQLLKRLSKVRMKNAKSEETKPVKRNKDKYNDKKKKDKNAKQKKRDTEKSTKASTTTTTTPSLNPAPTSASAPISVSDRSSKPGWNNWSAAQFESEDRKNKFLRFMGVKKPTEKDTNDDTTTSVDQDARHVPQFDSAISKNYAEKIRNDLEKQFNAGLAMRQQTQRGARGGLGF